MPLGLDDATSFFRISPLVIPSLPLLLANVSPPALPSPAFPTLTNAQGSPCPQSLPVTRKAHQTSQSRSSPLPGISSQNTVLKGGQYLVHTNELMVEFQVLLDQDGRV